MPKYSVKKPMTVFVVVIIIIALGVVSLTGMTPDLLPSIDLPYVVVMTTYPGATPEEVEVKATKPLEQGLATVENLKNIQSVSNANYSLIIMEFEADANMDSAVVNTLQSVDLVEGSWGDGIGSPYIMKLNPNMMPIAIAAVDMEGYDTEKLSTFVKDTLINELEGTTGVASISAGGLIESKINVSINEKKIDEINVKLLDMANGSLADAKSQLSEGMTQIKQAEAQLEQAKVELDSTKNQTYDDLSKVAAELDAANAQVNSLYAQIQIADSIIDSLQAQLDEVPMDEELKAQLQAAIDERTALLLQKDQMEATVAQLKDAYQQAERGSYTAIESFHDASKQLEEAQNELVYQKGQLNSAIAQVDAAGNQALEKANLGSMITLEMVSGILQGQNFSMPAGYIQEGDAKYLVSVGDELSSLEDVQNQFLFNVEGVGDIHLKDVADVFIADNSNTVYASINGNAGVMLTFQKQSNYPTATVSKNLNERYEELCQKYEGLSFTTLMDQGDYIYLIIGAIGQSLGYGALFAVIVLFIFLRDIKPTLITILSIPISIMFAIVLMYFSGVTLNMISLSGLAVSVGMLVDNSIVVIENIFRLRRMGIPAKKAAVAGAKQVASAIMSSTLTTVCVFAPIVFVTGLTRQLFTDMALTITYSLMASLIVALTLVPALASKMFVKDMKEEGEKFRSFQKTYRKLLSWNLKHKAVVLILSVVLLAVSVGVSVSKGFIFIPDMSTPQLSGSLVMNDEEAKIEETAAAADKVMGIISEVDGVATVGGMLASTDMLSGQTSTNSVSLYVIVDEKTKRSGGEISEDIMNKCKGLDCKVEILSSSSVTTYTSALGGSGVTIEIFGDDNQLIQQAAKEIGKKLEGVKGIKSVNNGLTDAEPEYHFVVDKEKAMRKGLTVAQVYMQIAQALTTEASATSITWEGENYDITVSSPTEESTSLDSLKNMEIKGSDLMTGSEVTVKLSEIATFEEIDALPSINRINQSTYLSVSGELEDGYNVTLVTQDAEKALKDYKAPAGIRYEFTGENQMIMDAMWDLTKMMALGVLLVYLIMVAQFQSLRSPFIVMFTIPLAFTGGLLALIIFGKEISIIAMLGLIMLVGIIVNNGIVLVDYINQLRAAGHEKTEAIIEAGATRIRPVLMTSLTTILGLVIMAFGKTAGTDMMQPIALVCIGGLVYATVLTLFVVPIIYDLFTGKKFTYTSEEDIDVSDIIVE
ncbi:MAG: efflux RND transporter permease subunit [Firmicutes bacterium]|nr:efflux RND transporter permease subunit [Bacillota bacterium]